MVGIYFQLGSGFLPDMDEGAFVLDYVMPAGTSLEETDRVLLHIEQFMKETPEVESYSRRTGARLALAIAEPNTGDFLVKLKRGAALEDVTAELREKIISTEPAIEVEFPHILEDLIGDLAWSPQPIEIKVRHDDADSYKEIAQRIEEWLPKVTASLTWSIRTWSSARRMNFRVDPEKARRPDSASGYRGSSGGDARWRAGLGS